MGPICHFLTLLYIADLLVRETISIFTPTMRGRGRPVLDQIENVKKTKRRSRVKMPSQEVAEDGIGHWPSWTNNRQRCKNCGLKSHVHCTKCACYFCLNKDRNCFKDFHAVLN